MTRKMIGEAEPSSKSDALLNRTVVQVFWYRNSISQKLNRTRTMRRNKKKRKQKRNKCRLYSPRPTLKFIIISKKLTRSQLIQKRSSNSNKWIRTFPNLCPFRRELKHRKSSLLTIWDTALTRLPLITKKSRPSPIARRLTIFKTHAWAASLFITFHQQLMLSHHWTRHSQNWATRLVKIDHASDQSHLCIFHFLISASLINHGSLLRRKRLCLQPRLLKTRASNQITSPIQRLNQELSQLFRWVQARMCSSMAATASTQAQLSAHLTSQTKKTLLLSNRQASTESTYKTFSDCLKSL